MSVATLQKQRFLTAEHTHKIVCELETFAANAQKQPSHYSALSSTARLPAALTNQLASYKATISNSQVDANAIQAVKMIFSNPNMTVDYAINILTNLAQNLNSKALSNQVDNLKKELFGISLENDLLITENDIIASTTSALAKFINNRKGSFFTRFAPGAAQDIQEANSLYFELCQICSLNITLFEKIAALIKACRNCEGKLLRSSDLKKLINSHLAVLEKYLTTIALKNGLNTSNQIQTLYDVFHKSFIPKQSVLLKKYMPSEATKSIESFLVSYKTLAEKQAKQFPHFFAAFNIRKPQDKTECIKDIRAEHFILNGLDIIFLNALKNKLGLADDSPTLLQCYELFIKAGISNNTAAEFFLTHLNQEDLRFGWGESVIKGFIKFFPDNILNCHYENELLIYAPNQYLFITAVTYTGIKDTLIANLQNPNKFKISLEKTLLLISPITFSNIGCCIDAFLIPANNSVFSTNPVSSFKNLNPKIQLPLSKISFPEFILTCGEEIAEIEQQKSILDNIYKKDVLDQKNQLLLPVFTNSQEPSRYTLLVNQAIDSFKKEIGQPRFNPDNCPHLFTGNCFGLTAEAGALQRDFGDKRMACFWNGTIVTEINDLEHQFTLLSQGGNIFRKHLYQSGFHNLQLKYFINVPQYWAPNGRIRIEFLSADEKDIFIVQTFPNNTALVIRQRQFKGFFSCGRDIERIEFPEGPIIVQYHLMINLVTQAIKQFVSVVNNHRIPLPKIIESVLKVSEIDFFEFCNQTIRKGQLEKNDLFNAQIKQSF